MTAIDATVRPGVPFLDLELPDEVRAAILGDIEELLRTNAFTNGPAVAEFERAFAAFVGTRRCVGVANGLDALRLALIAKGIEPGDEVLVPANTFIATFEAVTQAGGVPVPVDVSEHDLNLDPALAEAAVSDQTRFLLPVHLYGTPADMRALSDLARRARLEVLEDACQAHGAERDGIRAGTAGFAAAFSFYPGKNLGAIGDAGALTTDDDELADRVVALREHGQREKYRHQVVGWTARLDTIQAIALLHKLPYLEEWNGRRRAAARFYGEALVGVGDLLLPPVPEAVTPVWHLYVVRTARRDELAEHLRARGIGVGLHYPEPAHLSPAYAGLGYGPGSFPVTERLADEVLSLPMFPGIDEAQLDAVVSTVRAFFERG